METQANFWAGISSGFSSGSEQTRDRYLLTLLVQLRPSRVILCVAPPSRRAC